MVANVLLSMWVTLPIFIGAFIPLSFFVVVYKLLSLNLIVQVNTKALLATLSIIFYLLILSFYTTINLKEIFRYIDLALVILLGQGFVKDVMSVRNLYRFIIVFVPFFCLERYSNFNQNYPSFAIILLVIIMTGNQDRAPKLIIFAVSILATVYYSIHTALVGVLAYVTRITIMNFIALFTIAIYVLHLFLAEYPIIRIIFSSALVRIDLWFATLVDLFAELNVLDLFFGLANGQYNYTNGGNTYFSNFTFVGLHPHNQFIFILYEYGFLGLLLLLILLYVGLNSYIKRVKFIPLFAIFWFEASNDLMYFGLLAIILLLPTNGIRKDESIQKNATL